MSEWRQVLDIDVHEAARQRIAEMFDGFDHVCVSFSGGKDSGVALEMCADEARSRGRKIGLLVVDLEAQYRLTVEYVAEMIDRHADVLDPVFWVCLPLSLRNAVSQFEPKWTCWDPDCRGDWVRDPPEGAVTDPDVWGWDWYWEGMEFEEFTPRFAEWFGGGEPVASVVAIRCQESLNRWRSIVRADKAKWNDRAWTTRLAGTEAVNVYPIYDWATEDIWTFYGRTATPYNRLYDRMHQAGLTVHQARICQPYGDDQRKGLWLFSAIEPETWARVVARVNGANMGALYARTGGNVLGNGYVTKPDHLTWREFALRLLDSMPQSLADHYRDKIAVFLRYYADRGYHNGEIPDEGPANEKGAPSWTRICKVLLRNDYHCKGLSFSAHKSDESYRRYRRHMARKRQEWKLI